jgi:hypothetical protein
MTTKSIGRIAVPALTLVAACVATLVFAIPQLWHAQPVEPAAIAAPAPASGVTASATPAVPPRAQGSADGIKPAFDVSLIGRDGDAVIAGTATPGATLELLRNGEPHDRAIADQSGQFVMVPSRLPPGDYELTLRSTQPDGTQVTSQQSVPVSQPTLKDQPKVALITPDRASLIPPPLLAPSAICHPSRNRKR